MLCYIRNRLLQLIPVLLGITFLSFALMHSVAGDAVDMLYDNAGVVVAETVKAELRAKLGLDQPFIVQYMTWLVNLLRGDMGVSYISHQRVFEAFISKLPQTLYLAGTSLLLTLAVSVPLGIVAALHKNKFWDYFLLVLSFIGNSLPNFFVALLLVLIFSVKLGLFAATGGSGPGGIVLPALTLAIAMSAKYMRQVRNAVLDEMHKDYVLAARARGERERVIFYKSVLKVAILNIVTLMALSLGSLLGGTAIVETIFMWDGVGQLAIRAITMRDYPMIQAYVVWMAIIYVCMNMAADILYKAVDPRIKEVQ
jgi:peptide/nickel transport system permease protein